MNKKIRRLTETGLLLALLIVLQAVTKPLSQLVTGSCVNTVLAISVLFAGLPAGITVAVLSPVLAFLLGIAPQIWTVPAIMVGNTVYVILLHYICGKRTKNYLRLALGWLTAAAAKFAVLYALVVWVICGIFLAGTPLATKLPAMFSWPQLITALIGGGLALL
ncbi:MAG: ECF transporter S component, partial [Oscillospiraceae bacterium]|nr:ECF transporter S component [Oscillospiraceae bacterium]